MSERLRSGVELCSPFDRRSRWIYAIMALWMVVGVPLFVAMHFRYEFDFAPAGGAVALLVMCWAIRSLGWRRTSGGIESFILAYFYGLPLTFVIYPLLAVSAPLADPWLAHADRLLGFDWFAFIGWFNAHRWTLPIMVWSYHAFFWQLLIVFPLLWVFRLETRAWQFVTALLVAMTLVLLVYPFAPCDAAFVHYGVTQKQFPLSTDVPWTTSPVVRAFKSGDRLINAAAFKGIVTFPSFHTAMAVMATWAAWGLKPLRYPVLAINALMVVSCIVVGAHYLVDLLAGAAIGVGAIYIARRLVHD